MVPLDARDVQYSWKEYSTRGSQSSELVDACGVLSMNATDDRTLVIKLKAPSPGLFATASFIGSGRFNIVPREADGGFDIRREAPYAGAHESPPPSGPPRGRRVMHVPLAVALVVGVALLLVPEKPHAGARRAR